MSLIVKYQGKLFPSNGGILLFGVNHQEFFPDAIVRLGRFKGLSKAHIIDHQDLVVPITTAVDPILNFIERHTSKSAKIEGARRIDIPEYAPQVLREAIVNALLHADYSIRGSSITIAIFDDRIEITNPGALPLGLSLQAAISGVSQLRNRVIGRVFRELNLIEAWGSGLRRMIEICVNQGVVEPKFEELGTFFRVTLYNTPIKTIPTKEWHIPIIEYLKLNKDISPKQAQELWKVTTRTASTRLKEMVQDRILVEIATSTFDPYKTFRLSQSIFAFDKNI